MEIIQPFAPLNAVESHICGIVPFYLPQNMTDALKIQQLLVPGHNNHPLEIIRSYRRTIKRHESILGEILGLGASLAFSVEEINEDGNTKDIPKVLGLVENSSGPIIELSDSENAIKRLNQMFLSLTSIDRFSKMAVLTRGGFQLAQS